MPMKPIKFGFKLHCLTESKSGFCYDYWLDPGKSNTGKYFDSVNSEENIPEKHIEYIVEHLTKHLPDQGYNLYMDSWYNSINLAKKLVFQGISLTGPVKKNSKDLPKSPLIADLKPGEVQTRTNENLSFTNF